MLRSAVSWASFSTPSALGEGLLEEHPTGHSGELVVPGDVDELSLDTLPARDLLLELFVGLR